MGEEFLAGKKKRKLKRYKKLVEECEEHKWEIKLNRLIVSCRDFVEKSALSLLGKRFLYSKK